MKKTMCILFLIFLASSGFCDRIYFKNGDVLTGSVLKSDRELTTIETDQGIIEISTEKIDRIEYAKEEESNNEDESLVEKNFFKTNNSAIIWRPLPTLVAAISGYFDIVFEGQTSFSNNWAGTAILEFGSISGIFVQSLQIGPQYRPFGNYLNGFFIGLYPGIGYLTDYIDWIWLFSGTLEVGYEWIFRSKLVLGISTGFTYLGEPTIGGFKYNISAHIGWAMPDLLFKAK